MTVKPRAIFRSLNRLDQLVNMWVEKDIHLSRRSLGYQDIAKSDRF